MPDVHTLGIRHHGPGSARSVLDALDLLRPTLVLIEGPPELDPIAPLLADPEMRPPIAGLVYAKDDPSRASFFPLAAFSPEWVAARWALENNAAIRSVDLPEAHSAAIRAAAAASTADTETAPPARPRADPITALSSAAGYDEPERWWEDAVEQRTGSVLERFAAIAEAVAELRHDEPPAAPVIAADGALNLVALADPIGATMTAMREAAMRKVIRAAMKSHERIVVVCGAWHAPALDPAGFPPASADTALLRGLPKVAVAAAWVPWTASRLAVASGYGAGISSPGWYRHLFEHERSGAATDVGTAWLVRVAQELRSQGVDASTASVVEAARLATVLAAVRGRPRAGLTELDDAALSVLADGNPLPLTLVHDRLVVGEDIGSVPESAPLTPLAADLARAQRASRLKPAAQSKTITLDLRTDAGRTRSVLLHRLLLLAVPWGRPTDAGRTTGTFKEAWELVWAPELSVALVEASVYGTTLAAATAARATEVGRDAPSLAALSDLLAQCLRAETPVHDVVRLLADRAAAHTDTLELLTAIEPLATVCRYGNVRDVDTSEVRAVLDETAVRACIGLPLAAVSLDKEAAATARTAMESGHRGLSLLGDETLLERWRAALATLAERERIPGTLAGRATRLLLDSGALGDEEAALRLSRALSTAADPVDAAGWIDGFLTGDAAILVHDPTLLSILDDWLTTTGAEVFDDLLPLLRRTFSAFGRSDRAAIGRRVSENTTTVGTAAEVDAARAAAGLRAVARLIGWEASA